MATIIDQAANAIRLWDSVRNDPGLVINYFNQGSCFIITHDDYKVWEGIWELMKRPEDFQLHAYMGLVPNGKEIDLSIFCVDSATDSLPVNGNEAAYEKSLKRIPYQASLINASSINPKDINNSLFNAATPKLTQQEALQRSTLWELNKDQWIKEQKDMVQLFQIPFSDLNKLFNNPDYPITEIVMIPALSEREGYGIIIDMMLWGVYKEQLIWQENPEDLLQPCPPICLGKHELLDYALK